MEFIKGCIIKSCIVFNRKFVGLIDFYLIMKKYLDYIQILSLLSYICYVYVCYGIFYYKYEKVIIYCFNVFLFVYIFDIFFYVYELIIKFI